MKDSGNMPGRLRGQRAFQRELSVVRTGYKLGSGGGEREAEY